MTTCLSAGSIYGRLGTPPPSGRPIPLRLLLRTRRTEVRTRKGRVPNLDRAACRHGAGGSFVKSWPMSDMTAVVTEIARMIVAGIPEGELLYALRRRRQAVLDTLHATIGAEGDSGQVVAQTDAGPAKRVICARRPARADPALGAHACRTRSPAAAGIGGAPPLGGLTAR